MNEEYYKLSQGYQKKIVLEVALFKICDVINCNNIERKKTSNVSRETSKKDKSTIESYKLQLQEARINNTLLDSTKINLNTLKEKWQSVDDCILDDDYKSVATINKNATVVAASENGAIVTLPTNTLVSRIEKNSDENEKFLNEKLNIRQKIVYITDEYWKTIRPEYVEKIKNKELVSINEEELIKKIKELSDKKSVSEFADLIEMEG